MKRQRDLNKHSLVFLFAHLCLMSFAAPTPKSPPPWEIHDHQFKQRHLLPMAEKALAGYREYYQRFPDNPEVAYRLSMACQYFGHRIATRSSDKLNYFREGRDVGKKAVTTDPTCGPCQFWAGINMALYGETKGILQSIATLKYIVEYLEAAARLSPGYAYGGAYRVLGLIEVALPGILGGSYDEAEAYFKKAISEAPENPLNYFVLAKLFRDHLDQPEQAFQTARKGLSYPRPQAGEVESREAWDQLQQMVGAQKLISESVTSNGSNYATAPLP